MGIRGSYKWHLKSDGDGGQQKSPLTRRIFLGSAFAPLLHGAEAELSNFDLSLIDDPVVPAELFFVREHFPAPNTSSAGWKLAITGAVEKPLEFSYDELSAHARKVLPVTLECAENAVGGGLVSHAEWTGVPLAALIGQAHPSSQANFVRLSGADGFSRNLPLEKAMHADSLVAFSMNGEKLPTNHGFPLRAVIPGWYGMDSVKWLRSVEVRHEDEARVSLRAPYVRVTRSFLTGDRPSGPVGAMNVKSAFSRPVDGAILTRRRFIIRGAAWAGENRIREVEVSTDRGKTWSKAQVNSNQLPYSWTLWSLEWNVAGAGKYELAVRATDDKGRTQPVERATDRADGYELNSYQRIQVAVV
jgi:DMSO/TMAO reductase YedYZ molybdopterin-dependent catalytic subunit